MRVFFRICAHIAEWPGKSGRVYFCSRLSIIVVYILFISISILFVCGHCHFNDHCDSYPNATPTLLLSAPGRLPRGDYLPSVAIGCKWGTPCGASRCAFCSFCGLALP